MNKAQEAIINTLSYYGIFAHPLTKRELIQQLWNFNDTIDEALGSLLSNKKIQEDQGFYCLSKQPIKQWISGRNRRWWYTKQRLDIAQKAAKKLRYIPFIEAVFVCNQLPVTVTEKSDIDVFIVVKKDRLWISRLLATLLLTFFGMRRQGKHVAEHICLSFYIADSNLNLANIRINEPDIYLSYWLHNLIPIFDRKNVHTKLLLSNSWVKPYIYNINTAPQVDGYSIFSSLLSRMTQNFFEIAWQGNYGDFINQQAKALQQQKMKRNLQSKQHEVSTDVIISDEMLKFHENDRRQIYQSQWQQLCKRYVC